MCNVLYMASDQALPLVEWQDEVPAFHVAEISEDGIKVKTQFALPHIYYVGSHEGCGCGFIKYDLDSLPKELEEDHLLRVQNFERLQDYVLNARRKEARIQLYYCWEGYEEAEPQSRESIAPERLTEDGFKFNEQGFYEIQ